MIAVCIPSRGLMHSRTIDDLSQALYGVQHYFVFAHGLPQPDAQNEVTRRAISYQPEYIWYVDDDMKISRDLFIELYRAMREGNDVAVADYPVQNGSHTVHYRNGKFEAAGLGCVMIRPWLVEALGEPYFRTDTQWIFNGEKLEPKPLPPNRDPMMQHGGHDVDFWQRLLSNRSLNIKVVDTPAGQYYYGGAIKKYGNNTAQSVETWEFRK